MKIVRYTVGILVKVLEILGKRLFGKKHVSTWNLQTELIWATTRYTLISSNRFGLAWLKSANAQKVKASFRHIDFFLPPAPNPIRHPKND